MDIDRPAAPESKQSGPADLDDKHGVAQVIAAAITRVANNAITPGFRASLSIPHVSVDCKRLPFQQVQLQI
jgi:hypothetical protein